MNREAFFRAIVPRGISLEEHLNAPWLIPEKGDAAVATGWKRLEEWRTNAAQFDPAGLDRRLDWLGVRATDTELARKLRPVTLCGSPLRPHWVHQVWWLCQQLQRPWPDAIEFASQDGNPVPFEDLFIGLAAREEARLVQRIPYWSMGFSPAARGALTRGLIVTLSQWLAPSLEHEYSLFRSRHMQNTIKALCPERHDLYYMFLERLRAGEIYVFMVKYAAAARMAVHAVRQWRKYHTELSLRLAQDNDRLSVFLGCSPSAIVAESAHPGLSDRHENGRTVLRLELLSGHTLYYKPRPVGLESAIRDLIIGIDAKHGAFLPDILSGDCYGWVRAVSSGAPDLNDYYTAAGHLVALSWLLASTDLHDQNVVMAATGPVVIDGEMFASPLPAAIGTTSLIATRQVESATVLNSGLLPRWLSYNDGSLIQVNGLAGGRRFATGLHTYEWHHINTNAMAIKVQEIDVTAANVGQIQHHDPQAYVESLVAGFRQACVQLKTGGLEHLADRIPATLEGKPVRFLFRDTVAYDILLRRLRLPEVSLTTLDTEIAIEALLAPLVTDAAQHQFMAVFQAEKEALLRGDIPKFLVAADSTSWLDGTGRAQPLFSRSGVEMIRCNLKALERNEDRFQESLIRAAFYAVRNNPNSETAELDSQAARVPGVTGRANDPLLMAQRISSQLLGSALRTGMKDETLTWIAPHWQGVHQHLSVTALGSSLYDGRAGIGVFLAALAAVTNDSAAREGAEAIFQSFTAPEFGRRWTDDLDNLRGGCVGRASVVYALRLAGTLLDLPSYGAAARRLCAAITSDTITLNHCADWISGVAGEAVALWPMRDSLPSDWPDKVLDRLVVLARQTEPSRVFWPLAEAPGGQTGAGHGAAGIIHALGRLFPQSRVAQELRRGAGAYLASHWHTTRANWIPTESIQDATQILPDGWSHGAPGILSLAQDAVPRTQAEAALHRLATAPLHPWDTLATGNGAIIDLWISRGETALAWARTEALLARAQKVGGLAIPGGQFLSPGLFDGLAGVGYSFLRLVEPRQLPSVLRLEEAYEAL